MHEHPSGRGFAFGIGAVLLAAAGALREHARREVRAAALDRRQRLLLAGQQPFAIALDQRGLEALDQLGQRDHGRTLQPTVKRSISALMRTPQCSATWLLRWV